MKLSNIKKIENNYLEGFESILKADESSEKYFRVCSMLP